ncbi:unnamed protein product, partial [Anisakis simplex]|uniref:ANF_receptor domain-containing protein n=1 Tax=Anisakis simplex TaxID=6269 RepID=A0A0M3JGN5_ANISI
MLLWLCVGWLADDGTAEFTPHFRAFLENNYGIGYVELLERTDLGLDASFGGKQSADDELRNQAVIIV